MDVKAVVTQTELNGIKVAHKRIPRARRNSEMFYINEVKSLKQLNNSNARHTVTLIDNYEDDQNFNIFTKWCGGGCLPSKISCVKKARALSTGLVRGLHEVHVNSIVHGDLKPSNVMLDKVGHVRLIDFEDAYFTNRPVVHPHEIITNNCKTVVLRGTACYMSPERLQHIISPSNDVWALGVTLFYMFTGLLPFNDVYNRIPVIWRKILGETPNLESIQDDDARDFISICLMKSHENRPDVKSLVNHPWLCVNYTDKT